MISFWQGFMKQANDGGGTGFTGTGKGQNAVGSLEPAAKEGPADAGGPEASHELLDRERNPRSFDPHDMGPELEDDHGSHIRY